MPRRTSPKQTPVNKGALAFNPDPFSAPRSKPLQATRHIHRAQGFHEETDLPIPRDRQGVGDPCRSPTENDAFVGYGDGSYLQQTTTSALIGSEVDVDGGIFGLRYGRNYQKTNEVMGYDISLSNGPEGTLPVGTSSGSVTCATGECNVSIDALLTVRGRAGWTFNGGQTLGYGALGLAVGKIEGGIFNSVQQGSSTATGITIALGIEHMVNPNTSFFGEVSYVNLGDLEFGEGTGPGDDFIGDGDFATLVFGVNFKF